MFSVVPDTSRNSVPICLANEETYDFSIANDTELCNAECDFSSPVQSVQKVYLLDYLNSLEKLLVQYPKYCMLRTLTLTFFKIRLSRKGLPS